MSRPKCEFCGGGLDTRFRCIYCGETNVAEQKAFKKLRPAADEKPEKKKWKVWQR